MLTLAIVAITLALVFYTVGVWAARLTGRIRAWHVALLALGLASDASGTFLMSRIGDTHATSPSGASGVMLSVMEVTGWVAIALMTAHLVWAIVVVQNRSEVQRRWFHRLSVLVWVIWLVPYFSGAIGAALT